MNAKISAFLLLVDTDTDKFGVTIKSGQFHPIGGEADHGEDARLALIRETGEELSFERSFIQLVKDAPFIGVTLLNMKDVAWLQHFYAVRCSASEYEIADGDEMIYWIDFSGLENSTDPATRGLVRLIRNMIVVENTDVSNFISTIPCF